MTTFQQKSRHYYLLFNAPLHLLWVACLFYLPINFLLIFLFYFLFYVLGIQIGYHRLISHRAFIPRWNWLRYFLTVLGTCGLLGGPVVWSHYHRVHHAHSDTDKDPQNIHKGRWHAHYGWFLNISDFSPMVVKDILRDKWLIFIDQYCKFFPITLLILTLAGGSELFMACLTGMIFASQVDMSINSIIGHSPSGILKNNAWLSIPTAGTSLHKNHHDRPGSFNFGFKWYEFDPCKYIVPMLSK